MQPREACGRGPSTARGSNGAGEWIAALLARSSDFGAFYRLALPIVLWIVFVDVAGHYRGKGVDTDAALREAVEAELATRLCPGLRLDPASFRAFAQERGINHADLYQKRSPRLRKDADHLQRRLRDDPGAECQRMLDLYGGTGPTPRLLARI